LQAGAGAKGAKKVAKLQKNPWVDTSFLPDRERAKHEEDIRKEIELEYELRDQVGVYWSFFVNVG